MIPNNPENELVNDFEFEERPTNTFKLNDSYNQLYGFTDGLEAMKQAIYLILNIERYEYLIFSWNYGIELADLFGQPISYVMAELERRISEALLQDSRITIVENFEFDYKKNKVFCKFTVVTIFGETEIEKVVNV